MRVASNPRIEPPVKTRWDRKPCGCVKTELARAGKVAIRCDKHRGKPSKKRRLAYFDEGCVRLET